MPKYVMMVDSDMVSHTLDRLGEMNDIDMREHLSDLAAAAGLLIEDDDHTAVGGLIGAALTQVGHPDAVATWLVAQVTAVDEGLDKDPLGEMQMPALFGFWTRSIVRLFLERGATSDAIRELFITMTTIFAPMMMRGVVEEESLG